MKAQTAVTQVRSYIHEHYTPGTEITTRDLINAMPWLTKSAISASLWILCKDERVQATGKRGRGYVYKVLSGINVPRDSEHLKAPTRGRINRQSGYKVTRKFGPTDPLVAIRDALLDLAIKVEELIDDK